MKELSTTPSMNREYPEYLLIATREETPKIFWIHRDVFKNLLLEAGRRFKTICPLAPYPNALTEVLGTLTWKSNSTVFKWVIKKLEKLERREL